MTPKYPHIKVALVGQDGNAFAIIGRVRQALRRAKVPQAEIDAFQDECMNGGDYDHVLQVVMRTVDWS